MNGGGESEAQPTGWLATRRHAIWRIITHLWLAARQFGSDVAERHDHLVATDPGYPTALAAGSRAVVMVVIDNPEAAKVIAAVIADLLRVNEEPSHHREFVAPVEQWRPPTSYRPPARPLWDRDEWDDN